MRCLRCLLLAAPTAMLACTTSAGAQMLDVPRSQVSTPAAPAVQNKASCRPVPDAHPLELEEAIFQAICAHPQASKAWANARAHAAAVGVAKSAYLPTLSVTTGVDGETRSTTYDYSAVGLGPVGRSQHSTAQYGMLNLSWVLFDFGKRGAGLRQARELLAAANAARNDILQTVFFDAARAYYAVRDAEASVDATRQAENVARESLAAASAKHDAGAGTLSDRLQAQTTYRRAILDRVSAEGDVRAAVGALAVSMGLDANTPVRIAATESVRDDDVVAADIDALIDEAKTRHPKLVSARARLEAAYAKADVARSQRWPTISVTGSLTRIRSDRRQAEPLPTSRGSSMGIGIQAVIPLFEGFASCIAGAQAEADAQEAELRSVELQVSLDVWQSFQQLQAGAINLALSKDLIDDARRSLDVARGRYKEGVGMFIELLDAQTALADAQKRRVLALSKWRTGRLSLAASLGKLGLWTEH